MCTIEIKHCHDKNGECISFIMYCDDHLEICTDGCHYYCSCRLRK